MAESRVYKRNFITKVLFRIDFLRIPALENEPTAFHKLVAEKYPQIEPISRTGVIIGAKVGTKPTARSTTEIVWQFTTKDGSGQCKILPESLVIEATAYSNFSTFRDYIDTILTAFYQTYSDPSITRTGLRYINEIVIPEETDFLEWDGYIESKLASILKFSPSGLRLKRTLNTAEYEVDPETTINIRTGIFNSRYPAEIIRKEFIIDLDCYSTTKPKTRDDLTSVVIRFNTILTQTFEDMIQEKLRKLLDND